MSQSELTRQAEALLDQAGLGLASTTGELGDEPFAGKHSLGKQQVLSILRLKRIKPEATQAEIAAFVGCSQQSVSRWLADLADSTADALQIIQSDAAPAALVLRELLDSKQDKVRLDAAKANLTANKLLGSEDKTTVAVQVVIGCPDRPA